MRWLPVDLPPPGPGQVQVQQSAVGFNYIDVYQRAGKYPLPSPTGLGHEAAGTVVAVGDGVRDLAVGDRVAMMNAGLGAYATHRNVPADKLAKLPAGVSEEDAAAVFFKAMTAQYLVKKTHAVQPGDIVVVHAAAGGVGLILSAWCKALGATVIGTAGSAAKCQLALEHGAAHAIDYSKEDFVARVKEITGGKGVKVVYDSDGKDTFEKSLECLRPFGLMASFGNASGPVPPFAPAMLGAKGSIYVTRQTLFSHITTREATQAMADDLFAVVLSGQVKIHIEQRFPLAQVQEAHRALEARQTTGCTILTL